MFGEFGDKIVLIVLGVIIPPLLKLIWKKITKYYRQRASRQGIKAGAKVGKKSWTKPPGVKPAGLVWTGFGTYSVGMSSLVLTLILLSAYDRGYLPFVHVARAEHLANEFDKPYKNVTRGTLLVTVSGMNQVSNGNTMCAAVAESKDQLKPSILTNCGNNNTVATASFPAKGHHSAMTFLVPRGQWYMVTADGPGVVPVIWTQYTL